MFPSRPAMPSCSRAADLGCVAWAHPAIALSYIVEIVANRSHPDG